MDKIKKDSPEKFEKYLKKSPDKLPSPNPSQEIYYTRFHIQPFLDRINS